MSENTYSKNAAKCLFHAKIPTSGLTLTVQEVECIKVLFCFVLHVLPKLI